MFCVNCGSKLDDDSKFCTNCGEKVSESNKVDENTILPEESPIQTEETSPVVSEKSILQPEEKKNVVKIKKSKPKSVVTNVVEPLVELEPAKPLVANVILEEPKPVISEPVIKEEPHYSDNITYTPKQPVSKKKSPVPIIIAVIAVVIIGVAVLLLSYPKLSKIVSDVIPSKSPATSSSVVSESPKTVSKNISEECNCDYVFIDNNDGTHTKKCTKCGKANTSSCFKFSVTEDGNNNIKTYTCQECGYSYTEELPESEKCECTYEYFGYGDGNHTGECTKCGETINEKCSYEVEDDVATNQKIYTCKICSCSYTVDAFADSEYVDVSFETWDGDNISNDIKAVSKVKVAYFNGNYYFKITVLEPIDYVSIFPAGLGAGGSDKKGVSSITDSLNYGSGEFTLNPVSKEYIFDNPINTKKIGFKFLCNGNLVDSIGIYTNNLPEY